MLPRTSKGRASKTGEVFGDMANLATKKLEVVMKDESRSRTDRGPTSGSIGCLVAPQVRLCRRLLSVDGGGWLLRKVKNSAIKRGRLGSECWVSNATSKWTLGEGSSDLISQTKRSPRRVCVSLKLAGSSDGAW